LALGLTFTLAACGGSDSSVIGGDGSQTLPAADITGNWTGTWLSRTSVGGSTSARFTQTGGSVEGELTFTGSPCFSGGLFQGSLRGRDLAGTVSAGTIRVSLTATVSSTAINGTYSALEAGACSGDTGTFSTKR
jgi:hypothetical protein